MIADALSYGLRVVWRGQAAEVVDIVRRVDRTTAQIRLMCGARRLIWVQLSELELP